MLNFLRKNQRFFFIVIAAAVIISFCFFGTYSALTGPSQVKDQELLSGISGKPIMQQELVALCRLIENSPFSREKAGFPNFLNDGVIEKDFLSNGLGMLLAKRYFNEIKSDLEERIKRIQRFRLYVHPQSQEISVENVWSRFSPAMLDHFRALKAKSDQATTETLALMIQLYLDQTMLPPEVLKHILVMQQNQLQVEPDLLLTHTDFSLFGFKSIEDWFGPHFVPLFAQLIMNAAQLAEDKGYEVKTEEIRADLYQNIVRGYQQIMRNFSLNPEDVDQYFQMRMKELGMDEPMLLGTWKKVMLFRRLFEDGSGSILVDPLAYQQFDAFAKENVRIDLYQLPKALQLSDFRSMLKLQIYLESIAADPSLLRTDLRMPKQFASMETIEKRAPELIEEQFELEWKAMHKDELTRLISIKETWDWESLDHSWELLKKQFPEVSHLKATSKQERLAALETCDKQLRMQVDQFARSQMVLEDPEKIKLAMQQSETKSATIGIRRKGGEIPFKGIQDNGEWIALLQHAGLKNEPSNAANERLNFYTADGENFYSIQVVSRDPSKKVIIFESASQDGTLDKLLDKRLEEAYPEIRKKNPNVFQQSNGGWKPFKEVKDQVGKYCFADLLKSIEDVYKTQFGILPGKAGELPLIFYSHARMLMHVNEAFNHLRLHPEDPSWVKTDSQQAAWTTQWLLEKTEQVIERSTPLPFSKSEMFALAPHQWSSVIMGDRGAIAFYFVQERGQDNNPSFDPIEQGHQILSQDAKRDMMLHILNKIQQKKAIDPSIIARS